MSSTSKRIIFVSVVLFISLTTLSIYAQPIIDIWYGLDQSFGHIGKPQEYINIFGNVSGPNSINSLSYSLNGGVEIDLSIGPDTRRLADSGDFNVDILCDELREGTNVVIITATDDTSEQTVQQVNVTYDSSNVWPLPFVADWSSITEISQVAQVVDGDWLLDGSNVLTAVRGYDRLVAIGDVSWTDYEVLVPITIYDGMGYSGGVGVLLRWTGHTDTPLAGWQPKTGWFPLGAVTWFRRDLLEIVGNNNAILGTKVKELVYGTTYMLRARVETMDGQGDLYSMKVWEQGLDEPVNWDIVGEAQRAEPAAGSLMLIAHYANASFGKVEITPIGMKNIHVDVTDTTATVNWYTELPSDSFVEYGTSSNYTDSVYDGTNVNSHSITLTGLLPNTQYHFQITSVDPQDVVLSLNDITFLTNGPVISDDFNSTYLDPNTWTFLDPVGDCSYELVETDTQDALLKLSIPSGTGHDVWTSGNNSARIMQDVLDVDFEVEVKFESVLAKTYQIEGIIIEQDTNEYLRFDFYRNGRKVRNFVAGFKDHSVSVKRNDVVPNVNPYANPIYMRVRREGDVWTQWHSHDGSTWIESISFSYPMTVNSVGPFAGNAIGSGSPAFDCYIDYFFNTTSPVVPEDNWLAPPELFTAYVDLNAQEGDETHANVTAIIPAPYQPNYAPPAIHPYVNWILKDFETGADLDVTINVIMDIETPIDEGTDSDSITDAGMTFGGIVDGTGGYEFVAPDDYLMITFDNLDPAKEYELALTYNRGEAGYTDRVTMLRLWDADTYTQSSSDGVVVNSEDSISVGFGANTTNGYVARWTGITAGDGSFSVIAKHDDSFGGASAYAMTSVMLKHMPEIDEEVPPDRDAPTPDPMNWATVPTAINDTAITMSATIADDDSGVEYNFNCITGGGHDSGWQDSVTYTDTGLTAATSYTYRIQARDKSAGQNTTALSGSASATTDSTPPAPAAIPISHWSLDEGSGSIAGDSAGSNDGTIHGASWEAVGAMDGALSFNGSNSYVDFGNGSDLDLTGSMTLSAWIYPDSLDGTIISKRQYRDAQYLFDLDSGSLRFLWYNGGWKLVSYDASALPNQWSHVAATYDSATGAMTLYVNGSSVASDTQAVGPLSSSLPVCIGAWLAGGDAKNVFDGVIDQVKIFDSTLSAGDVLLLYNERTPPAPDTDPPTPDPMTWATAPVAISDTVITMTATTASDDSAVEYNFTCTAGGGHDSGWQDSVTYTDTGLTAETSYTYRIQARDKSAGQNTTALSGSASATTDSTPPVPAAVPISHWSLDEGSGSIAGDSAGSNDGTIHGASWEAVGAMDGALSFNGSNSYVDFGNGSDLDLTGSMTLSAWIYPDSLDGTIISKRQYRDAQYLFDLDNGSLRFLWYNGGWKLVSSDASALASQWSHVAATYDSDTGAMTLYVNGSSVASDTQAVGPLSNRLPVCIGAWLASGTAKNVFDGVIDQVKIFDSTLSAGDVLLLYNERTPPAPDTDPPTPDPMTWATAPVAISDTVITMTATTASDDSAVEYNFTCTVGSGHDSGWQDSVTYTDTGLTAETSYTYRIQARDKSAGQNTTALSASASATTDMTPAVPAVVPISHWSLDEGSGNIAGDSAGSNDGTIHGASWATVGATDKALDFNGSNSYVDFGNGSDLDLTGSMTLSAWIYPDSLNGTIISKRLYKDAQYLFDLDSGSLRFLWYNGGWKGITKSGVISTGTWSHVAATYDPATGAVALYVNGSSVASGTQFVGPLSNSVPVCMGAWVAGGTAKNVFDGVIDQVKVFDSALLAADVLALYNE